MTLDKVLHTLFGFDAKQTTIRTEIFAGITTFLTMSYILAVNPDIFSHLDGMPTGAVFTATALAAIIGSLVMAVWGKLPFGLAPGMGLNAFFVFTVCIGMGKSWQFALTAIFIEGLLFILMTITNLREAIVNAIPQNLRYAIGGGIGLFIAFLGLQNAGVVINDDATLLKLGDITSGAPLLTFIGLIITALLWVKKIPGAMLLGILCTMLIGLPMGITDFKGIVSAPQSVEPIFLQFEWENIFTLDMLVVVFTFLFLDMFDTIGTLVGVCTKSNMVNKDGSLYRGKQALMADAIATTAGAILGTSTTTTYVESASGIAIGGRSGLTTFAIACCFGLALFFSPLFLSIPAAATAPVLIITGLMMLDPVKKIDLDDYAESIPAFICLIAIPMTYSISNGILLGCICYVLINLICGNFKRLNITLCILSIIFILKYIFM